MLIIQPARMKLLISLSTVALLATNAAALTQEELDQLNNVFPKNEFFSLQAYSTSGGTLPSSSTPTTSGFSDLPGQPARAHLITVQHTYAASFDIDLAPYTTPDDRLFAADGFDEAFFGWAGFRLHREFNLGNWTEGFRGEDFNYFDIGKWDYAFDAGYDVLLPNGGSGDSLDDLFHPTDPIRTANQEIIRKINETLRFRMTCNIGPQLLTVGPALEGIPVAQNSNFALITGPLALDWGAPAGEISIAAVMTANGVKISWDGSGRLQRSIALPGGWENVPNVTGNSYEINEPIGNAFFRVVR
jgi:hypothetical protein